MSSREWVEVIAASDRCGSYLYALHLNLIAGLDAAKLAEQPSRALSKDSRHPASQELAPVLRISGRSATCLVGLARQLVDLPAAEEALSRGEMTPAQWRELVTVCRRLPEGVEGERARRVVEATAVAAAATLSRARLAATLEEAALAADPGYAARAMAAGINDRDVVLRPSPLPGCARIVADLEAGDAARVWQVINQIAANALAGDTENPDDGAGEGQGEQERRTKAQLRADVLASLVVGDIAATPETIAQALGQPIPAQPTDHQAAAAAHDDARDLFGDPDSDREDTFGEDGDFDADAEDYADADFAEDAGAESVTAPAPGPADNRAPVRIPTPEQRARLSEIHIVVLADDLIDDEDDEDDDEDIGADEDPEDPEDPKGPGGPGDGPEDGPEGDADDWPDEDPDGWPGDWPSGGPGGSEPGDGGAGGGPEGRLGRDDELDDWEDWPEDRSEDRPEDNSDDSGLTSERGSDSGSSRNDSDDSGGSAGWSSGSPPTPRPTPSPTPPRSAVTSPSPPSPPSSTPANPPGPGRDRPRRTTPHPTRDQPGQSPAHSTAPCPRRPEARPEATGAPPPAPNSLSASTDGTSPADVTSPAAGAGPAAAATDATSDNATPSTVATGSARLRAARAARRARRPLAGYGPFGYVPGAGRLSPEITRAAIRAARWRRLVADQSTGVLLHRSRWTLPAPNRPDRPARAVSTGEQLDLLLAQPAAPDPKDPRTRVEVAYRPSTLLAAFVRSRDATCISPVCHHPTRGGATQLDHTVAYGPHTPTRLRGGLTEAGNLGSICVPWHQAKTHGDWTLEQPSPGSFVWTSPTGLVYHRRATPVLPDLAEVLPDVAS
ncbi:hypothetical protein SAMN06264364_12861 [Quadrisphaera granulorum]|uniref:DUF222 domain-containing protein n=1 Tax=Quadrisphaera granulorum TaxID=317664 RepID=A0A315ZU54_9ACTN|nr:hypothetical protein [Quadrisphaera granulorum]PWJ48859.1 hypothetical protein BXY45_12861 [Quadrisphaera granulorum]SZE98341.1 hypothetical protein SAMN06264364_12861 [Quadrisphaera granulorum]